MSDDIDVVGTGLICYPIYYNLSYDPRDATEIVYFNIEDATFSFFLLIPFSIWVTGWNAAKNAPTHGAYNQDGTSDCIGIPENPVGAERYGMYNGCYYYEMVNYTFYYYNCNYEEEEEDNYKFCYSSKIYYSCNAL